MSATDIWDILRDSMYNREEGNAFITSVKLRKIWSGDRLERFSRDCQLGLDQAQIKTTKAELLHIISCLVGIAWPDWSRFRSIFFPPEGHLQDRRRDCNALDFTRDELEHESFLGKGPWADLFDRVRWTYFPVVLTPYTHETYHHHRLPLIPVDSEPPRQGGYGEITKEKIPAGQIITGTLPVDLSAPRPKSLIVARKRFPAGRSSTEKRILEFLRSISSQHDRILSYLSIFTVGNELNIIFPWADMDLEDFLRGGYKQMASTPSLLDIIIEAEQLADAIDHLHKPRRPEGKNARLGPRSICHLDLKPRNILVFKESSKPSTGKWKITDFGISRMGHEVPSEMSDEVSEDDASNYARWAGTFNAPPPPVGSYQCPDSFVHPKNDIWSFGCILVRLFALAFDPSRLEELDRSRIGKTHGSDSYDHDHFLRRSTLRLNPHVASWIKALPERYGMDYDTRFLKGIRHLLGSMLSLNIQNRLTAHKVYINLLSLEDLLLQSERQSEESRRTSRPSTIAGGTIDTYQSPGTIAPTTPEPDDLPPITTLGIFINQILNGTVAEVKELLQRRRDLEKSYNGKRPLIWAIERKDGPVLQALLEHDPKPDLERLSSEDSDAQTPLHLAISVGSVDIVTHLLEAGALVDSLSQSGMTPLMHAAHRGHADIIKELLRFNADWKIFKARDNWNCLHYAVNNIHCSVDVIKAFNGHMDFDWTPPDLDEHKPFTTPLRQHVLKCFGFYSKNEHDKWCEKFDALIAGGADVNREHIPHSSHPSKTMLEIIVHEHEQDLVLVAERLIKAEATLSAEYRKPRYISFAMKDLVKSKFPSAESSRRPGHLRTRTISSFFQR